MWRGVPKPVALPDQVAGLPATYVPSQGEIECVRAVTFLITTSNTAGARRGVVSILDGQGVAIAASGAGFTVSASKSQLVSLFVGGSQFGADDASAVGGSLYERWLDGNQVFSVDIFNRKLSDKITQVRLDVVGYPQEWYDTTDG